MKKAILAILALSCAASYAGMFPPSFYGTDDVPAGTRCSIEAKKVIVLAASEEDCVKVGGVVTHVIKQVSVPVKKK